MEISPTPKKCVTCYSFRGSAMYASEADGRVMRF
jgi:hypothetical protein